jgi:hypothetical protein
MGVMCGCGGLVIILRILEFTIYFQFQSGRGHNLGYIVPLTNSNPRHALLVQIYLGHSSTHQSKATSPGTGA